MDEYEVMRKFGREDEKIAGKMREMRALSEVEKMKCGPDGRQSASRERGMTGIERLREFVAGISPVTTVCGVTKTAYDRKHMESIGVHLRDFLTDISDQIEREQGEHVSRMRVLAVVTEMERHVSGVEGAEDSPVARWARELREALGGDGRDPAADVSVSAYDLLPQEDREAIAWVRDHGGLDAVDAIWDNDVPLAEAVISELWPDGRPDECGNDDVMGELRRRLMPEGCEWPRFEDGEQVRIGDEISWKDDVGKVNSIELQDGGYFILHAADGAEDWILPQYSPVERVRRPAVLAADGEPLEVGQTVWDTDAEADTPLTVVEVSSDLVRCEYTWKDGKTYRPCYPPDQLTHQRPDTWQRIEEDIAEGFMATEETMLDLLEEARDIVRRCRALAEREKGE